MMKLRKSLLLFTAALVLTLTACGGGGDGKSGEKTGDQTDDPVQVTLTDYDVGDFTVGVPEGWMALPTQIDVDEYDPSMITLLKDPKSDDPMDLMTANKMIIIYDSFGARAYGDLEEYMSGYLTDAKEKDVSFLTNEGITWTAYEGNDLYDMEILVGKRADQTDHCWEVTIYVTDALGERIMSIDDPELQAVVNSLNPKV